MISEENLEANCYEGNPYETTQLQCSGVNKGIIKIKIKINSAEKLEANRYKGNPF